MSGLPFGFVYDERMLEHKCGYDDTMQERPERMLRIYNRLQQDGLLKGAVKVEARKATDAELMLNHPGDLVRELEELKTDEECEEYCKYAKWPSSIRIVCAWQSVVFRDKEILWLCSKSAEVARVAAGGTIELVKANIEGRVGNSFAIVRPPGHHAFAKTPQGYCVFNNVAIAAKFATEHLGIKKVAVVDFDYHAGNGTHYCLRGDPQFHFTSFHAFHHGSFWPYSSEFDYNTEYSEQKKQSFLNALRNLVTISTENTLMFPLNGAMNTECDFVSAFHHILLPMLRTWKPQVSKYYQIVMCPLPKGKKCFSLSSSLLALTPATMIYKGKKGKE
ncbi:histone deacetylase family protein [Necator americanus]|uniref:Histone deacetylase family protein n=1 Tax=Necator americanus TaxID=51031 RepID=W2SXF4_NECAM|nr:histone deacetylase family protein [Necator americanus]ETN74228.1 histone deacetylase family protein [Necator americanus]